MGSHSYLSLPRCHLILLPPRFVLDLPPWLDERWSWPEHHGSEQLAQSCYTIAYSRSRFEPRSLSSLGRNGEKYRMHIHNFHWGPIKFKRIRSCCWPMKCPLLYKLKSQYDVFTYKLNNLGLRTNVQAINMRRPSSIASTQPVLHIERRSRT